jgi:hypothetical protein
MTILLRGANDYMLDEMDRSLHDALCIVKRVLESGTVVPGVGGGRAPVKSRQDNHPPRNAAAVYACRGRHGAYAPWGFGGCHLQASFGRE